VFLSVFGLSSLFFFAVVEPSPCKKIKNVKRKRHKTRFTYFRIFVKFHFSRYVHMYVYRFVCKFVILFFRRFAFCSGSRCFYLLQSTVINNLNKQPKINTNIFEAGPPSFQIHLAPQRANCFSALLWQ